MVNSETELRYRTLFEQSPDGILILDLAGNILEFNTNAHQQLGYSREEFEKMRIVDLDPVETTDEVQEKLQVISLLGKAEHDVKHKTKQGDIRDVHVIVQRIELSGKPVFHAIWRDITERKKAEEARRQLDNTFRALFDHAPLGIVLVSTDRRILNCNLAFQKMLGYSLEELKSLSVPEISHAGDDQATRGSYQAMMAGEIDSYTVEKRYIRKNGTTLWAHLTGTMIRDDKGAPQSIFGIVEDITERKQSEDALQESERRYKAIVEDQAEFVTRYLPGGVLTFVNDTLCKYLGMKRDDLLGNPIIHSCIRMTGRHSFVRSKHLISIIPRWLLKQGWCCSDGRVVWHKWTHHAIFDNNGAIIEYQSTGRDITNSKLVEEALQSSEARFRTIIENASAGIQVVDIETRQIRYANPEICRMLGYSEQELRSLLPTDLVAEDEQLKSDAAFQQHAAGNMHTSERTFKRKDGSLVRMSIHSVRMKIDDRQCLVGFFSDVTEKHLLEEERLKTQKLEAIGTLAGGIAHDFNNLLQGVFGYISLAKLKNR